MRHPRPAGLAKMPCLGASQTPTSPAALGLKTSPATGGPKEALPAAQPIRRQRSPARSSPRAARDRLRGQLRSARSHRRRWDGVVYEAEDRTLAAELRLNDSRRKGKPTRAGPALWPRRGGRAARTSGIVPVHQLGIDSDGHVFYAMRRIRGMTLAAILERLKTRESAPSQPTRWRHS